MPTTDAAREAKHLIEIAEAAAKRLLTEAATAAEKIRAQTNNGHHDQLRADMKIIHDEVMANRKAVDRIAASVMELQRFSLKMTGATALLGGVLIFALSRALGL